jgi:phospholipid/cholesterol/gamma-HCH transport system substrate-binding protein
MSNEQKVLEVKVGLFVFVGLAAIAVMAVQFGRLGQGLTNFYPLTVEFKNASGLVKNSDVQLSGAIIGHVSEKPYVAADRIGTVMVKLNIRDSIKLPRNSTFVIGSSGLLGDKFVEIAPPLGFDAASFNPANAEQAYAPGETVAGSSPTGLDEITKKVGARLDDLSTTLNVINQKLPKLLSNENLDNLSETFSNVRSTSAGLNKVSGQLSELIVGGKEVLDTAKTTVKSADKTMQSANAAIADVRDAVQTTHGILKSVQSGNGAVPTLLTNPAVANDLKALISNIRKHGLLFYKNSYPETKSNEEAMLGRKPTTR